MTGSRSAPLLAIIALARSGSLRRARQLFADSGLETVVDDPAVLSVRGRLLKGEAQAAEPDNRACLWREAGDAYARAAELSGASYHLVNAATLALLAGDCADAVERARQVLARLDAGETGPETPYYLAATRAEALLLLGRRDDAEAALEEALRQAPEAWEDHASTLRQFTLILTALEQDDAWLEPLRPPRSLHFAGPLALVDDPGLRARIDAVLTDERIGFAWGALAGGADLIVSEAVLARGAELHLVLPAPPAVFRADSAAPLGGDWTTRFDDVLARAASVTVVDSRAMATTMLRVRLAAEAAMGKAVINAAAIASEAVQLLLVYPDVEKGATTEIGDRWRAGGGRQVRLDLARAGKPARPRPLLEEPDGGVLTAMLAVAFDGAATPVLDHIAQALAGAARTLTPPAVGGNTLHLAFARPSDAALAAGRISSDFPGGAVRIAGHYGVARLVETRFGSGRALIGTAAGLASDMLASVPPGAIHLSGTFAAALNAGAATTLGETTFVGELTRDGEATALYALTPAPG